LGDKSDILVEYWWIDYSENDKDPSKNLESSKEWITWKYPLLGMIFSGLWWSFALLRRYRIV
jgi:hypothetical protein